MKQTPSTCQLFRIQRKVPLNMSKIESKDRPIITCLNDISCSFSRVSRSHKIANAYQSHQHSLSSIARTGTNQIVAQHSPTTSLGISTSPATSKVTHTLFNYSNHNILYTNYVEYIPSVLRSPTHKSVTDR